MPTDHRIHVTWPGIKDPEPMHFEVLRYSGDRIVLMPRVRCRRHKTETTTRTGWTVRWFACPHCITGRRP